MMETVKAHSTEVNELVKVMNTSLENGLSGSDVNIRLEKYGKNEPS